MPSTLSTQPLSWPFADSCTGLHGVSPPHIPAPRQKLKNLTILLSSYLHFSVFANRFAHLGAGARARSMPIFVLNDPQLLHIMAAIRCKRSHVQNHCALAAVSFQAPTTWASNVYVATLACTSANSYHSCSSLTNCDDGLFTILLLTYRLPAQRLVTQSHHSPSDTSYGYNIILSTVSTHLRLPPQCDHLRYHEITFITTFQFFPVSFL